MNAHAQYEYFDGSGNGFVINENSIKYVPVTPERSSSGTYSGGQAKTVSISAEQYVNVRDLLDDAIAKDEIHQADRAMMTGLILKITPADTIRVVLSSKAPEKNKIEETLRRLLK